MSIKPEITWHDFEKIDMRAGTIVDAKIFEKARKPAYQLEIDFGELGIKKSSAQITDLYTPEALIGQQVIAVVNFPKKQIANFFSECLVLGIVGKNQVITLLQPEQKSINGLPIA
ncbi:tRNA-binding protein [Elizabethkingia meningoseptica]|uniref:tRNA-binding protein n=1 Tax=Elizabethkingia meningoseptica TaxID=238 RepID=UPI003892A32B